MLFRPTAKSCRDVNLGEVLPTGQATSSYNIWSRQVSNVNSELKQSRRTQDEECVCVRARARACVCVRVCVCVRAQAGRGALRPGCAATAVSRPFPSWNRFILTEISLCHACSCQEILRTETAGQARHGGERLAQPGGVRG